MSKERKLLQRVINSVPFHSSHESLKSEIEAELAKPEAKPVKLCFPTMLRKMWSGGEVQKWLDEQPPLYTSPRPMQRLTDEEYKEVATAYYEETACFDADRGFANAIMDAMIEKNKGV